jgi:hypothetical protein
MPTLSRSTLFGLLLASLLCPSAAPAGATPPKHLQPPIEDGPFLVPAPGDASEPVWGIKGGIAVGLWPTSGPRGLIRVYTPYLGQARLRVMNFVAVEPIVGGARGLSELERSDLDRVDGKAMWTGDAREANPRPREPWRPACGTIRAVGDAGAKELSFFVFVEPFLNGARPAVQVVLRDDRPHEVAFRAFASEGGSPMRACILTATMGNYARLRKLWLDGRVIDAATEYRDAPADAWGFAPHRHWGLGTMRVGRGEAIVAATPDEPDPASAQYARDVAPWWHYEGRPATQYWKAPAGRDLVARVNARTTYWASKAPIPGGVAFENFELEAPFAPGQEFRFGITPARPEALGFKAGP